MLVKRMEILDRQKNRSWANKSIFPDSMNTETPRKLVFSLTCLCLSVCAKKLVSEYLTNKLTDVNEKIRCMLLLAWSRESSLTSTILPKFTLNLGRGVIFGILLTLISWKLSKISQNRDDLVDVKFKVLQIWPYTFFDISNSFWDIFKKLFFKKFCQGSPKRLDLGQSTFEIFVLLAENHESPLDSTVGAMFLQN